MSVHKSKRVGRSSEYTRNLWVTENGAVQCWVNDLVWKVIGLHKRPMQQEARLEDLPSQLHNEAMEVFRLVLESNELHGIAVGCTNEQLRSLLTKEYAISLKLLLEKTRILDEEIDLVLEPSLGKQFIVIDDAQFRPFYEGIETSLGNPRFINMLTLWAPTLTSRDDLAIMLDRAGYLPDEKSEGYVFWKITNNVMHMIELRGMLWDQTKNWTSDLEREIWDRASLDKRGGLKLDTTDLFLMAMRFFAVDSLAGSGIALLDMVRVLEYAGEGMDWERLRQIKNMFKKPTWFWAAMLGLKFYESNTGDRLTLPEWVRESLKEMDLSFLEPFMSSRLNWANPDTRLGEFPRAWAKLTQG